MLEARTTEELLLQLGEDVKRIRLTMNIAQTEVARRAGVSRSALVALENGAGATLTTFVNVLRALGRLEWLSTLAPQVTVSPMQLRQLGRERQRASAVDPSKARGG